MTFVLLYVGRRNNVLLCRVYGEASNRENGNETANKNGIKDFSEILEKVKDH